MYNSVGIVAGRVSTLKVGSTQKRFGPSKFLRSQGRIHPTGFGLSLFGLDQISWPGLFYAPSDNTEAHAGDRD